MTILDTFYTLFKADTTELDKGLADSRKNAKATAEELKATDLAARKLGESIGRSIREFATLAAGYLAVRSLSDSFMQAVDAADKLDESTSRLGLNIEEISAWGDVVKKNGGSVDTFIGSIEALNKGLSAMEVTGKSRVAPFLLELGIDLEAVGNKGKNALELLLPIADAMEGMDKQKSAAIGQKLGLDQGTIATLQQGRREVEELIRREKELGVITKEQGEIAGKFGDQLDDTRHAFRSLWLEVSTSVLPALQWFVKKFEEVATFMRNNKSFIVGLMIAIGAAIAVFAIPPLLSMAAAAVVALAPFLLIGAAVAAIGVAFALAYDDVMNFIEGNDSLIGQFLEEFPVIGEILKGIGDYFGWLSETIADVGQILWTAFGMVFQAVGTVVGGIFSFWLEKLGFIGEAFGALGTVVSGIFLYWIDLITQFLNKFGGIVGIAKAIGGAISGGLGAAKDALGIAPRTNGRQESGTGGAYGVPGLAQGKQALAIAGATPLASQTSNSIGGARTSNKTSTVKIDNVNVQTQATDAAGISKSIGDTMSAQMRAASANADDGVAI